MLPINLSIYVHIYLSIYLNYKWEKNFNSLPNLQ
jgi:hypothetical protein